MSKKGAPATHEMADVLSPAVRLGESLSPEVGHLFRWALEGVNVAGAIGASVLRSTQLQLLADVLVRVGQGWKGDLPGASTSLERRVAALGALIGLADPVGLGAEALPACRAVIGVSTRTCLRGLGGAVRGARLRREQEAMLPMRWGRSKPPRAELLGHLDSVVAKARARAEALRAFNEALDRAPSEEATVEVFAQARRDGLFASLVAGPDPAGERLAEAVMAAEMHLAIVGVGGGLDAVCPGINESIELNSDDPVAHASILEAREQLTFGLEVMKANPMPFLRVASLICEAIDYARGVAPVVAPASVEGPQPPVPQTLREPTAPRELLVMKRLRVGKTVSEAALNAELRAGNFAPKARSVIDRLRGKGWRIMNGDLGYRLDP